MVHGSLTRCAPDLDMLGKCRICKVACGVVGRGSFRSVRCSKVNFHQVAFSMLLSLSPLLFSRMRRLLAAALVGFALGAFALPCAWAQGEQAEGVRIERSRALSLASAQSVEREAAQQFAALKREAAEKRALAPADHPQLKRLRRIAEQLIVHAPRFNERAGEWKWEVILIGSRQVNAFCMPGGKIAFFTGILDTLKLDDDEVAMVMGHEIAHALLEHGRERVGKGAPPRLSPWVQASPLR